MYRQEMKQIQISSLLGSLARLYAYEGHASWASIGLPVLFGLLILSGLAWLGLVSREEFLIYTLIIVLLQIVAVRWARSYENRRRKLTRDAKDSTDDG